MRNNLPMKNSLFAIPGFIGFGVMLLVFFSFSTNPSTPEGYEGYVKENPRIFGQGGYRGALVGPANYGLSFWRNEVVNVDFRPKTYTEKFRILTQDELNISFSFQTIIKPEKGSIKRVVEEYSGDDFYARFIREPLRSMVRKNVQTLDSREVKGKREEISNAVKKELTAYLEGSPFVIISTVVGNIDYPNVVTAAVEKKLAAQQMLEEKETQIQIAIKNAAIAKEEAKGLSEAQEIINKTLTTNYLQYLAIKAQLEMASSPNHTTVYIPSGANGIPIVKTAEAEEDKK